MDPAVTMALGAISRGSGTTPTLMGFGSDSDKLVVSDVARMLSIIDEPFLGVRHCGFDTVEMFRFATPLQHRQTDRFFINFVTVTYLRSR